MFLGAYGLRADDIDMRLDHASGIPVVRAS
jgi:hypothetical protein